MLKMLGFGSMLGVMVAGLGILFFPILPAWAQIDRSGYISPDELKVGMKGFGRTVLSGTAIESFDFEVIGVMQSAWYAKQDMILVRCSGLNLEHSGVIGGMSGSPCYVWDSDGKVKLIGAVAYGWTFNKDPICGLQPITQMIDIPKFRMPQAKTGNGPDKQVSVTGSPNPKTISGKGVGLGEIIARNWCKPIRRASRFSIFNRDIAAFGRRVDKSSFKPDQLQPLKIPVMITGGSSRAMSYLHERLEHFGMMPVISGAAAPGTPSNVDEITIEPGSVLCVAFMTGDMVVQGLGTCTEVIGDRVLGFGHSMHGRGSVELPLATGMVHTVIPSVLRSSKIGSAVKTVGTLWGDETTGVFGVLGKSPAMIDLEVAVDDIRGLQTYRYQVAHDKEFSPLLMAIETDFEGLGVFRTGNMTSQDNVYAVEMDLVMPILSMMNAPFGKARISGVRAKVTVKEGARLARIDQATLPKTIYKPSETVAVRVRWFHHHRRPFYTYQTYSLSLPSDLPDGKYKLSVGSMVSHLTGLRKEKPHLFRAESLSQVLRVLNRIGSFSENRVYMRLILPASNLAVKQVEMPELPSFRRQILSESKRSDVHDFTEAKVVQHPTDFMVSGNRSFEIEVSRRADQ
ncbi:MAG: hypothetical protein ACYTBZ_25810 [Planctomycetota bacterium]|jgi:hypothetical protein